MEKAIRWRCISILLGARLDVFDFISFDSGTYFTRLVLHHRAIDKSWEFIGVYGPIDHTLSHEFLLELATKIGSSSLSFLIGGDFNLLRFPWDKNNVNFSWSRAEGFNDFIINFALRELHRVGSCFTWCNHQLDLVRSVLDRVLISLEWDSLFPRSSLIAESSIGSDHTPLLLDSGMLLPSPPRLFKFEASWLLVEGFIPLVSGKILELFLFTHRSFGPLDDWNFYSSNLRGFFRGWGRNHVASSLREKDRLLSCIKELDSTADLNGLDEAGWAHRYELENALLDIHRQEEVYWQQCGRMSWLLKGDSITAYFFAIANGRHRRCSIFRLVISGEVVVDPSVIQRHIFSFFSSLLAAKPTFVFLPICGLWRLISLLRIMLLSWFHYHMKKLTCCSLPRNPILLLGLMGSLSPSSKKKLVGA